jgi:hypothetical protein
MASIGPHRLYESDLQNESTGSLESLMGLGIDIAHGYATLGKIGFEGRFSSAPEGSMDRIGS